MEYVQSSPNTIVPDSAGSRNVERQVCEVPLSLSFMFPWLQWGYIP